MLLMQRNNLKSSLCSILVLLCLLTVVRNQTQNFFKSGSLVNNKNKNIIPFELRGHKIYVKIKLNDQPRSYNFILDTGAFTSIDKELAEELNLSKGTSLSTSDMIINAYMLREDITLRLHDFVVKDFKMAALDFSYFKEVDPDIDGFLGANFLRFFNILIDYQQKQLILSLSSHKKYTSNEEYIIKLDTQNLACLPKVDCQVNHYYTGKALIDTGSPFTIIFPLSFLSKFSYSEQKKFIESKGVFVRWPWTSIEKNYIGRIDELRLGNLKLQNIPVIFANTEDIILGKEFLSQCITIIDYPGQQLIIKPYNKFSFRDNYFTIGLQLYKNKQNRTFVEAIWRGSPADQAGIDIDDEILKINSRDTKSLSLQEISNILNNNRIPRIEIVNKKSYSERTIVLKKEALLPL